MVRSLPKPGLAGQLAEVFMRETFGVSEPEFEIKAVGNRNSGLVLNAAQLLNNVGKQYVVVRYKRTQRKVRRGERKGLINLVEGVRKGFESNPLRIIVIQAEALLKIVMDEKAPLQCSGKGRDVLVNGKWGLYWRVRLGLLPPDHFEEFKSTDRYTIFSDPMYPPAWASWNGQRKAEGYLGLGETS